MAWPWANDYVARIFHRQAALKPRQQVSKAFGEEEHEHWAKPE
jgi:hypothetical protein